jgi:hypothetical protein
VAIRDKLRTNVQPLLEPGETIQSVFPAQSGLSPYFMFITYLLMFWVKYVIIAATDRRILVLKASPLRTTAPKEIIASFPRETTLGPVSGLWGKVNLGGTTYWVHRRFHNDVEAADAAAAPATAPTTA